MMKISVLFVSVSRAALSAMTQSLIGFEGEGAGVLGASNGLRRSRPGSNFLWKSSFLVGLALASLSLSGCATPGKLTRLDSVSPNEAIAVARFHVIYNDKDGTKGCNIIFDGSRQFILDESGYVFAKLPIGTNYRECHLGDWY